MHQNNGLYDYDKFAQYAGALIERNLGIPAVRIEGRSNNYANTRMFPAERLPAPALNNKQILSLTESPYDVTLFIDADFLVTTPNLREVLREFASNTSDMWALHSASISTPSDTPEGTLSALNPFDLWSTVMIYRQGVTLEGMQRFLQYQSGTAKGFRNDFAVARYLNSTGRSLQEIAIPATYKCLFGTGDEVVPNIDNHVMNKRFLTQFLKEIENA